jgi:hypothetical protein
MKTGTKDFIHTLIIMSLLSDGGQEVESQEVPRASFDVAGDLLDLVGVISHFHEELVRFFIMMMLWFLVKYCGGFS